MLSAAWQPMWCLEMHYCLSGLHTHNALRIYSRSSGAWGKGRDVLMVVAHGFISYTSTKKITTRLFFNGFVSYILFSARANKV